MSTTYRDGKDKVRLIDLCRNLRKFTTPAEMRLWRHLRDRRMADAKFRRQHEFGPYILDFYCHESHLVIEADGNQHGESEVMAYDAERTQYLAERGLRVMRFTNAQVMTETESVLQTIFEAVTDAASGSKP